MQHGSCILTGVGRKNRKNDCLKYSSFKEMFSAIAQNIYLLKTSKIFQIRQEILLLKTSIYYS